MRTNKAIVYTAITGGKDAPRDDIWCFDEYERFKDPVMNAKIYKVLPHLFFEAKYSIWIDGNIKLLVKPEQLVEMMGDMFDIAVFTHPERDCIYEEGLFCKSKGKGDPEDIDKQLARYRVEEYPERAGLGACYIIVRRHIPQMNRLCEKWWAEICAGSSRDQLSFPYIFQNKVQYLEKLPFNNHLFTRGGHAK
jgi:hypothetical protein